MIEAPQTLYTALFSHFRLQFPLLNIRSQLALVHSDDRSVLLRSKITIFDYVIISQRRYHASTQSKSSNNSFIAVSRPQDNHLVVGELLHILVIDQETLGRHILGHVRWLMPAQVDLSNTFWAGEYVII